MKPLGTQKDCPKCGQRTPVEGCCLNTQYRPGNICADGSGVPEAMIRKCACGYTWEESPKDAKVGE